jgi:hypothetical protein
MRRWRAAHPDKVREGLAKGREWTAKNPDKMRAKMQRRKDDPIQHAKQLKRAAKDSRERRVNDPRGVRSAKMRSRYNITLDQYEQLTAAQGGVCAICGSPEAVVDTRTGKTKTLAIDHCHDTEEVRGLLCTSCNQGIGRFKDNPALLLRAAGYLTNPPARTVITAC